MSTEANTLLFERAAQAIDYWEGTTYAKVIEQDLANNDLEQLAKDVNDAHQAMFQSEYQPNSDDPTGDLSTLSV